MQESKFLRREKGKVLRVTLRKQMGKRMGADSAISPSRSSKFINDTSRESDEFDGNLRQ